MTFTAVRAERRVVGVYGTGGGGQMRRGYKAKPPEAADVLGVDWMDRHGMSQSIPPAYTAWIGSQLIEHINERNAA